MKEGSERLHHRRDSARLGEVLHVVLPRRPHAGDHGVVRARRSKSSSPSGTPARPAIAGRWTTALVEPPTAMRTRIAFSNAARVRIREGRRSSLRHLDDSPSGRFGETQTAGKRRGDGGHAWQGHPEGFGHRRHRAGGAHHHAVPVEGKSSPWIASMRSASISPARCSVQSRRQSVQAPSRMPS